MCNMEFGSDELERVPEGEVHVHLEKFANTFKSGRSNFFFEINLVNNWWYSWYLSISSFLGAVRIAFLCGVVRNSWWEMYVSYFEFLFFISAVLLTGGKCAETANSEMPAAFVKHC